MNVRVVVALGGNALLQKNQKGMYTDQLENARRTAKFLADIIENEPELELVITHGNGPQAGAIAIQNDAAKDIVPPMPLDVINAETQALIGYMLQQSLKNEFARRGLKREVVTIVTQVVVRRNDPAFQNPTKFIGPYYTEEEAKRLMKEKGWIMKPDPRGGWRRVVPSPEPIDVVEKEVIMKLLELGIVPITVGGGGIPVVFENGCFEGIEAVIDKDLASSLLARILRADLLVILTDVDYVYLDFENNAKRIPLREITLNEIKQYYDAGHFPAGSMGPKVLAAIKFLEAGGREARIGHLEQALNVIKGLSGTRIKP
ncbi:MAG: carbamate kinase [Crenarchaeota archaeon]|nr:carbamate kinase [Thermoproteota archaeon]MCR8454106.1 carbamate kinase [Thermoproteota archaeon]MCR8455406.1 carbamate kinase [Thermoproteota archaeon]MCR8463270.1 carbamate kinase [Thermoproteota archaeon]MCR8471247.1 carbamate kinase [Thermoproteota archaeon]